MKLILKSILLFTALTTFAQSFASAKTATDTKALGLMQDQLVQQQKALGEWAGINEGDPRWDVFFMVYTDSLFRSGVSFMTKAMRDQVVEETLFRVKSYRGYQENGWSLHAGHKVSKRLTGSILLALNHVDPNLTKIHFPTQQKFHDKKGWGVGIMSVLDRFLFRMMGAPGHIMVPVVITPSMFGFSKDSSFPNMAEMGYYRWGFVSLAVWAHFDEYRQLEIPIKPMTEEILARKGAWLNDPTQSKSGGAAFWALEGLAWLMERPHGDGNPAPTLIVQMAMHSAHKAKVMDLSKELKEGWEYMNSLRYPMRNSAKVFQPSISPVWDTARVLSGLNNVPKELRKKSLNPNSPKVRKAIDFLLKEQDVDGGDYLIANPNFSPGGWGFAYGGNKYPDSDDTAMVVDALVPFAKKNPKVKAALEKGVQWLLQIQNPKGGFPAWDYDATEMIEFAIKELEVLPNTSLEPQADVTARVLRALKHVDTEGLVSVPEETFTRGCSFLKSETPKSGPHWAGTWAVNYLYGTSEVLSALISLNCLDGIDLQGQINWLKSIQNEDGGWGESVRSYSSSAYVRSESTITQTLGALQLLLSYENYRVKHPYLNLPTVINEIKNGVDYYLPLISASGDIHDENEKEFTACYACPYLFVRYDLIPLYMGTEVLGKYLNLKNKTALRIEK